MVADPRHAIEIVALVPDARLLEFRLARLDAAFDVPQSGRERGVQRQASGGHAPLASKRHPPRAGIRQIGRAEQLFGGVEHLDEPREVDVVLLSSERRQRYGRLSVNTSVPGLIVGPVLVPVAVTGLCKRRFGRRRCRYGFERRLLGGRRLLGKRRLPGRQRLLRRDLGRHVGARPGFRSRRAHRRRIVVGPAGRAF